MSKIKNRENSDKISLVSLFFKEKTRFIKFALVGFSGVFVNSAALWLLVEFSNLPFYLCSFIAIELSILSNFILNDNWTWQDRKKGHLFTRLFRYNMSTAFSSIFINMTFLLLLKEWMGCAYLLANLAGIGFGVIFNFMVNSVWTYGQFRFSYPRSVWILFFSSLLFRLVLASGLGAGFDEAYYYAYSIHPSLSYFDHPPMVGFLAGYFPYITGKANPFTIRLAAILLYSLTGLLLFQLARQFVNQRKAVWALFLFNITPIFFLLAGIFILPDAGLVIFWILTLMIFYKIIYENAKMADWILAGITTGLAMLSKYHGVLLGFFLLLYFLIYDRRKFLSPGLYLYGIISFLIFSPVLFWNAQHHWISFVFQSSRALGSKINFDSFFQALGGQLGYLTPMLFIPMIFIFVRVIKNALKKSVLDRFFLFFGVLPVLLFLLISISRPILPHWTLVGYIILTVPLADMIETSFYTKRWARGVLYASVIFLLFLLIFAFGQTRYGVLHLEKWTKGGEISNHMVKILHLEKGAERGAILDRMVKILNLEKWAERGIISNRDVKMDATLDMVGWEQINNYLKEKDISSNDYFLFTHRWMLSGQVDLATRGTFDVMCFDAGDPRGYGIWDKNVDVIGKDAINICTNRYTVHPQVKYAENFESFSETDSVLVYRGGIFAKTYYFTRCYNCKQKIKAPF